MPIYSIDFILKNMLNVMTIQFNTFFDRKKWIKWLHDFRGYNFKWINDAHVLPCFRFVIRTLAYNIIVATSPSREIFIFPSASSMTLSTVIINTDSMVNKRHFANNRRSWEYVVCNSSYKHLSCLAWFPSYRQFSVF